MYYGINATLPTNTYTREGWTFKGWSITPTGEVAYTDGAAVSNLTSVADSVVAFYAVWERNAYNVTFKVAADVNWQVLQVVWEDTVANPGIPFSLGYDFIEWQTPDGHVWNFHYDMIKSDTTLIAQWSAIPARVDSIVVTINGTPIDIDFDPRQTDYDITLPCVDEPVVSIQTNVIAKNASQLAFYLNDAITTQTVLTKEHMPTAGHYIYKIVATLPGGAGERIYRIDIMRRYNTTDVVLPYKDGILAVNLNPDENGGYTFIGYDWLKDGQSLGINTPYLYLDALDSVADKSGNYAVKLITEAGVVVETCDTYLDNSSLNSETMTVYPNPVVSGKTTVVHTGLKAGDKIEVYDMSGTLKQTSEASGRSTDISIGNLPSGIYVVKAGGLTTTIVVK
jgi:hypothetical protein